MKCPKCKRQINIGKQTNFWDKNWGKEATEAAYFNIECLKCNKFVYGVSIDRVDE